MLQTVNQLSTTVGGLCKQVEGLQRSVDNLALESAKQGKWIFAANLFIVVGLAILGWIGTLVADVVKQAILAK